MTDMEQDSECNGHAVQSLPSELETLGELSASGCFRGWEALQGERVLSVHVGAAGADPKSRALRVAGGPGAA